MFTGIVEELGQVVAIEPAEGSARITVCGPLVTDGTARGDSIAVSGTCLTVTGLASGQFSADVMGETLGRTILGGLAPGDPVNLERPMRLDGRLGGHLVQGHVDGTGVITARTPAGDWEVVRISMPAGLSRYVVEKGSVTVDGVSLTVSGVSGAASAGGGAGGGAGEPPWFEVSLIPETLARTTLGRKHPGAAVNLEVDMIAKYVERLLQAGGEQS
ncbi:MAG: riboflavin synthase [Streptosporangiaceae bacterium]